MSTRVQFLTLAQWLALGTIVGLLCGAASALFLKLLAYATGYREAHAVLVYALPFAGYAIGFLYQRIGQSVKAGNNLVIDTIHDEGPKIPLRMAPIVLVGTVLTHLFGGSAGREGTAVQMGASLADAVAHRLHVRRGIRRQLIAAGVAGGFGSVFGTPIAGALFGLEFVILGSIEYDALVPCLVASVVGDMTTRALGVTHTEYPQAAALALSPLLLVKWLVFAACVAAVAVVFIELPHLMKKSLDKVTHSMAARMLIGGACVVVLWKLAGTSDYLGLGVPVIARAFVDPQLPPYTFALKLIFTVVTLGTGFLGGEVTPLFFIGACLGNMLAQFLGLPLTLGAGVGLAAMFASAANTPIALAVMAMELCGRNIFPHVAIVCVLAYLLSGHRSIYASQRMVRDKGGTRLEKSTAVRDIHLAAIAPKPTNK